MPSVPTTPAAAGPAAAASPAAAGSGGPGRGRGRTAQTSTGGKIGQSLSNTGKQAAKAPIFSDSQKAAVSGGSIAVGLIAYAIGVNYLQHGWPGVTAWLKAKLMNQTSQDGNGIPQVAGGIPAIYFHTGAGAGTGSAGTQQTATPAGPTHPAAPTPSGGTLYA